MENIIIETLRSLSITGYYRGYRQAIIAIKLILQDEERLYAVVEKVYSEVAAQCGCNIHCVERNLRTIIARAWRQHPERLQKMARYKMTGEPSASEFLDILANHVRRRIAQDKPLSYLTGTWRDY